MLARIHTFLLVPLIAFAACTDDSEESSDSESSTSSSSTSSTSSTSTSSTTTASSSGDSTSNGSTDAGSTESTETTESTDTTGDTSDSTTTTSGGSESGSESGTSSSSGAGASSEGTGALEQICLDFSGSIEGPACDECVGSTCCDQLVACDADTDCSCVAECLYAGQGNPDVQACLGQCGVAGFPPPLTTFFTCVTTQCGDACPA